VVEWQSEGGRCAGMKGSALLARSSRLAAAGRTDRLGHDPTGMSDRLQTRASAEAQMTSKSGEGQVARRPANGAPVALIDLWDGNLLLVRTACDDEALKRDEEGKRS
jgi:hypothetical protein